ncbi:MAG: NADP-dependent isocitrate dehydrogenase, partial [Gammaproteobacteria bacterium]|nr:NADP-dependent isocitrate dehydrogenase [Gammaproteobacteria bacterium]
MPNSPKIIYTLTDEAPFLATQSLLPIVQAFTRPAGVEVETRDISLSGRILAQFADRLGEDQRVADHLAELGELAKTPDANIIKLPNISASEPQLRAAIRELQDKGFDLPDFPAEPSTDEEREVRARYGRVLGSAVNPVLREGNSDRRAPKSVKDYARKNPHRMGTWTADSKSHVAHMADGDFYSSERSATMAKAGELNIEFVGADGQAKALRGPVKVQEGEVVDAARMSRKALAEFMAAQIEDARAQGVLFSLHLKATMMKVSDPIMFGVAVQEFYRPVLDKHADALKQAGFDRNSGIGDLYARLDRMPEDTAAAIRADIDALYGERPGLAMVNSDKGITNLHVPSDVIVDASMPAMIRDSGRMWNAKGELQDAKAVIPDR